MFVCGPWTLTHTSTTTWESCTQFLGPFMDRLSNRYHPAYDRTYLANIENARFTIFWLVLRAVYLCFTLSRAAPREREKYALTLHEGVPWLDPIMYFYLDHGSYIPLLPSGLQIHFRDVSTYNANLFLEYANWKSYGRRWQCMKL